MRKVISALLLALVVGLVGCETKTSTPSGTKTSSVGGKTGEEGARKAAPPQ